jgi:hypothetical protein
LLPFRIVLYRCISSAAYKRRKKFESLLYNCDLHELWRENGTDTTSVDICRRVARLLSQPQSARQEVASIVSMLRTNSVHVQDALEEFFGIGFPENFGANTGEISFLGASSGCGLYMQKSGTEALLKLDMAIERHHAARAVSRALAWSGIRRNKRQPESVDIDIPELGLILSARAAAQEGEPWSISAVIDRAANYEWIPAYLRNQRSARAKSMQAV